MKLGRKITLPITDINKAGIGIGKYEERNIYIPSSMIGDEVVARIRDVSKEYVKADLVEVIKPSSNRAIAACLYYPKCGGCSLQHMNETSYLDFKTQIARNILSELNIESEILTELVQTGFAARRRVSLKVAVDPEIQIGFFAEGTNDIVTISKCLVASDEINGLIEPLRVFIADLQLPHIVSGISLTMLDNAIDLVAHTREYFTKSDKVKIKDFCLKNNIARFTQDSDKPIVIFENEFAIITFAGSAVNYPANSFLQATKHAEEQINKIIAGHLIQDTSVADLFCGLGPYSFNCLKIVDQVAAYEGSQEMVTSAQNAALESGLSDKIRFFCRDLFKRPVLAKDLNKFDIVILNPPRDGAKNQVIELAKSRVSKIIMVSCNPDSFKRDTKLLLKADYKLTSLTPIDQFYFTKHLELIGVFTLI
jgi:23S rRNA (uracil1939-C5)-methyltransferase